MYRTTTHDFRIFIIDCVYPCELSSNKPRTVGTGRNLSKRTHLMNMLYLSTIPVVLLAIIHPTPILGDNDNKTTSNNSQPQQKRNALSHQCRQQPTWIPSLVDGSSSSSHGTNHQDTQEYSCADELQFRSQYWYNEPLSPSKTQSYWEDEDIENMTELDKRDITEEMVQCIQLIMEEKQQQQQQQQQADDVSAAAAASSHRKVLQEPKITAQHIRSDGMTLAVEIESALSEKEGQLVQALATCQRRYFGKSHFEVRSFGEGIGGNNCTFLSPTLQIVLPGIAAQVMDVAHLAWKRVGWENHIDYDFPNPKTLGIRTSEHLRYSGGSTLGIHRDFQSVYTVLISLSDPQEYEGGEFILEHEGGSMTYTKLAKLKAMVFLSDETDHGVNDITAGVRETFANELWAYSDTPLEQKRPSIESWADFLDDWEWDPDEAVWEKPIFDDEDGDYEDDEEEYGDWVDDDEEEWEEGEEWDEEYYDESSYEEEMMEEGDE